MEKNKLLGLIGLILGVGAVIGFIIVIVWIISIINTVPALEIYLIYVRGLTVSTILSIGGIGISIVALIKGKSKLGSAGLIVSIIILVFVIIYWIMVLGLAQTGGLSF